MIRGDTSVAPLSPIVGANHIIDVIVYWRPMFQPPMNKIIGAKHWRQGRLWPIRYSDTVIANFYAVGGMKRFSLKIRVKTIRCKRSGAVFSTNGGQM